MTQQQFEWVRKFMFRYGTGLAIAVSLSIGGLFFQAYEWKATTSQQIKELERFKERNRGVNQRVKSVRSRVDRNYQMLLKINDKLTKRERN